jgi:GNAT superfamily N-acetyltransferase
MVKLQIRLARREDVPAIVRLLAEDQLGAARESAEDPLPEIYWDAFERLGPENAVYVADVDGTVVGCLQLTFIHGLSRRGMTRAQIEGVRVAASHRGAGIGEALMRDAIERARRAGCKLVQLTTDQRRPDAHRFYERLGFVASHLGMKLGLD